MDKDKKHSAQKEDEISLDMSKLSKFNWEKIIISLIMISATLVALSFVFPLFQPGIPLNIDNPLHYARMECYQSSGMWSLTTFWCSKLNAGAAFFQGYQILPFQLMAILSALVPMELAFKLVLVLIYFALPLSVFFLLNYMKKPLAGAFAFAFLLLEHGGWHTGGFEQIFNVGMFSNTLGSAMLILAFALTLQFFDSPNNRTLFWAIIGVSLLTLAHIISVSLYTLIALVLVIIYHKNLLKHWKLALIWILTTILITSFWLIPVAVRHLQGFYTGPFDTTAATIEFTFITGYLFGPISKILLVLGILGLILFLFFSKKKELKILSIPLLVVLFLWLIADFVPQLYAITPYKSLLNLQRLSAEVRTMLFIFAALLLAEFAHLKFAVSKEKRSNAMLFVIFIVVVFICYGVSQTTSGYSKSITTSTIKDVDYLKQMYSHLPRDNGRVMQEQLLYRVQGTPLALSHAESLGPILSGREFMVYNSVKMSEDYEIDYLDGYLNQRLKENPNLTAFFDRSDIKYVIASSPSVKDILNNTGSKLLFDFGPWTAYDTQITPNIFALRSGEILSQNYHGTTADIIVDAPQATTLLFKVHDYPNWEVKIDGVAAKKIGKPGYLMELSIPEGKHTVTFAYKMVALDYLSYLVTLIGIILLAIILIKPKMLGIHAEHKH